MTQPLTTEEALLIGALTPAKVTVGNQTVESRSADDLIKLDRHLHNRAIVNPFASLFNRTAKMIPPGGG